MVHSWEVASNACKTAAAYTNLDFIFDMTGNVLSHWTGKRLLDNQQPTTRQTFYNFYRTLYISAGCMYEEKIRSLSYKMNRTIMSYLRFDNSRRPSGYQRPRTILGWSWTSLFSYQPGRCASTVSQYEWHLVKKGDNWGISMH